MKSCNVSGETTDKIVDTGAYLLGKDLLYIYIAVEKGTHGNGHKRMEYHGYDFSDGKPFILNEFFVEHIENLVPISDPKVLQNLFEHISGEFEEVKKDYVILSALLQTLQQQLLQLNVEVSTKTV